MNKPASPTILLGITGGIAAYKTPELVRRLRDQSAVVRVVMSAGAQQFVTPLTLQAVSGHPVRCDLWDLEAENAMGHIELARFAEQVLIAPASADFIAKLALGRADDLLTTLCLATTATVYIAPSMNRVMWENKATQDNIQILRQRGIIIIPPALGEQACGEYGEGRMPEVTELVNILFAAKTGALAGKRILITAGPTLEPIDPVRYISNHSSGKMGYALAFAAKMMGAQVTLVSGPVHLSPPAQINTLFVTTAQQMYQTVLEHLKGQDIFIGTAAVADYSPAQISTDKLKKDEETMTLNLKRTLDILAAVASQETRPLIVGFAAETTDLLKNAQQKLLKKNMDMICVNDVSGGQAFNQNDNAVTILTKTKQIALARTSKTILAQQIMQQIVEFMNEKRPA